MREDHRLTTDEDAYGRRKIILPLGHPAETQYCETLYIIVQHFDQTKPSITGFGTETLKQIFPSRIMQSALHPVQLAENPTHCSRDFLEVLRSLDFIHSIRVLLGWTHDSSKFQCFLLRIFHHLSLGFIWFSLDFVFQLTLIYIAIQAKPCF
jgi:hypothetical protein